MGTTSWAIGSHPAIGATTITIDAGSGNEELDVITEEQGVYLYDGGSAYDALTLLQTAIRSNPSDDLDNTVVYLTRDRKVRIEFISSAPDPVFVDIISWGGAGATAFQTLLGFTGTEITTGITEFTAPETSPYLWSPNARETSTMARRGELGAPYKDTAVGMSGTRVVVATTNNTGYANNYIWRNVENPRYWSATPDWGEYYVWWDYVQSTFRRFKLYSDVNELDASTEAATLATGLGPYIYRWGGDTPLSFPFHREIEYQEFLHAVEIPVVVTDEYE